MKKWNVATVRAAKGREKLGFCTAYDVCFARLVGDMPFGSYQYGDDEAVRNAVAIIRAGAEAVKLEGGASVCGLIRRLVAMGIPVLAHVGMTPQGVNEYGGYKKQGKARVPSFVQKYADLATVVRGAFSAYVNEVKKGEFPE